MTDLDAMPIRFSDKVWVPVDVDPCWLWTAALDAAGYGRYWHDGRMALAHRVAYEALVGEVPEGMPLDHRCFVHNCVNPAHLEPVTSQQNAQRRPGANANSTSGIRNVYWDERSRKWRVRVRHNGVMVSGGYFVEAEAAEQAAADLRRELHTIRTGE